MPDSEGADWLLVQRELAHLDTADEPARAFVRKICIGRLGITHAAACLRQEMLFLLAPDGVPWYDPDRPEYRRIWITECNRFHYLAGVAGLTGYTLPEPREVVRLVRHWREERIRAAGGEGRPWWW